MELVLVLTAIIVAAGSTVASLQLTVTDEQPTRTAPTSVASMAARR